MQTSSNAKPNSPVDSISGVIRSTVTFIKKAQRAIACSQEAIEVCKNKACCFDKFFFGDLLV